MKSGVQLISLFFIIFVTQGFMSRVAFSGESRSYVELDVPYAVEDQRLNLKLVYPKQSLGWGAMFQEKTLKALKAVNSKLGLNLKDSIAVFFDPNPDLHNGLTTVVPDNRIIIHLEPPRYSDSTGIYRDYLLETLTHEFAHMVVMQNREGLFKIASALIGTSSRPLGLWPRWMHEGLAVWVESFWGGRPTSGAIRFDERKLVSKIQETGTFPFSDTELDGQYELKAIQEGDFPYHYGWGLIELISLELNKKGFTWADVLKKNASNLGLSFRVLFKKEFDINLDHLFQTYRNQFIAQAKATAAWDYDPAVFQKKTQVESLVQISGAGNFVTWIEAGGDEELVLFTIKSENLKTQEQFHFRWRQKFSIPLQAFSSEKGKAWVLFRQNSELVMRKGYDPSARLSTFVGLFDENGKLKCLLDQPQRPREIYVDNGEILWIEQDENYIQSIKSARLENENCQTSEKRELNLGLKSFQRISGLSFDPQNQTVSFHVNTNEKEIFKVFGFKENRFLLEQDFSDRPVFGVRQYGQNKFVGNAFWADYFGPVFLVKNPKTGILEIESVVKTKNGGLFTFGTENTVCFHEGSWDHDQVLCAEISAIKKSPTKIEEKKTPLNTVTLETGSLDSGPPEKAHSRLKALWPEFWVPTAIATDTGIIFQGETFFFDYDQIHSGRIGLGYESASQSPYVSLGFTKRRLGMGPLDTLNTSFLYYTSELTQIQTGEKSLQNKIAAQAQFLSHSAWVESGYRFESGVSLLVLKATEAGVFDAYNIVAPAYNFIFSSLYGKRFRSLFFRLPKSQNGWVLESSMKFLKGPELYGSVQGQFKTGKGTVLGSQFEYGYSDPANFPASYFEVTGLQSLAFSQPQFLNRGFPYRFTVVPKVLRIGLEYGIPLGNLFDFEFSWNRLSLRDTDIKLIYETTSFSTFTDSEYKIGKRFFNSIGAQIDLWGGGLHYIKYKVGLGVFQGFGRFGDLRFNLSLNTGLNI